MRSGSQRVVDHASHSMQKELLRSVRTHDVHAYRCGQHTTCVEKQVQVRTTICDVVRKTRTSSELWAGVLTDGQAQCAGQDAPADGEMPGGGIGLAPSHAQLESGN